MSNYEGHVISLKSAPNLVMSYMRAYCWPS